MTSRKKNAGMAGADRGTIVGLFRSQAGAERAIRDLKHLGIAESRIGAVMQDRHGPQEVSEDTTGTAGPAAEGATAGALSGGILGGVVGLLAGVGALAIPGIGPIIAGGALVSALAGAGIGAAAGGLMGALVAMGVAEEDARYFEKGFQEGSVIVTVSAGSNGPEAREILVASGADLGGAGRAGTAGEINFGDPTEVESEAWRGGERRYHDDLGYAGPERRLSAR